MRNCIFETQASDIKEKINKSPEKKKKTRKKKKKWHLFIFRNGQEG